MKLKIPILLLIVAAFSLFFSSCKKNTADRTDTADYSTELSAHSYDQVEVAGDVDNIADEANTSLDDYNSFNGRLAETSGTTGTEGIICGATVAVDSVSNPKKITLTYNGVNCQGTRNRAGVVVLSLPAGVRWKDAGAVLTISIQNLKITRVSDNKGVTINGTETITNVNGGRLRDLAVAGNITHLIASSGITITFDNGSQRMWQIAKKRVFTYNNGVVITTTGTHTDGSVTGISEWGSNRLGNLFVTSITQPMVVRQDCSFRLVSGQVTHNKLAATGVVTFGLDSGGNPTSCPGTGTYYFKLAWTGAGGVTRTIIMPY